MSPIRKFLLLSVGVLALHGAQACSAGTELNPQPLPPSDPTGGSDRTPASAGGDKNGGATGPMAPTPAPANDAGAEGGDASDAGAG